MNQILVVDDEEALRGLLARALVDAQQEVHTADSAALAMQRAQEIESLDVAIIDLVLADGSGFDVAAQLRNKHPQCEIIFVTGDVSLETATAALRCGAFDYITKPLDDLDYVRRRVAQAAIVAHTRRMSDGLKRELEASEERYRKLFQTSSDGILIVDPATGRIEGANPAAQFLYGYSEAQLRAKSFFELTQTRQALALAPARAQHIRADGGLVWLESSHRMLSLRGREVSMVVLRDVDEVVRHEQHREVTEARMREFEKMEALGRLAAGVAHDFNNLLFVIHSYSQFLLSSFGQGDGRKAEAEQIQKASAKAIGLAQQLLAFGRTHTPQRQALNLNQLVVGLYDLLRGSLREEIDLIFDLDDELWETLGDASHLERVVVNIVVNARDAITGAGRVTLHTANAVLDAKRAATLGMPAGRYVVVRITDTGCGMDASTAARVFEPFFSTKRNGGTGMGLASVYSLVRAQGGRVMVDSALGRGSTFSVYLPPCDEKAKQPVTTQGHEETPSLKQRRGTVLLVEDDDGVRGVLNRMLAVHGFDVMEARGGEEAMRIIDENLYRIDAVLTDVVMPAGSGAELAQHIRRVHPDLPVSFMSGHDEQLVSQYVVSEHPILQKPFTEHALLKELDRLLPLAGA